MSYRIGLDAKIHVNTGTYASPTWAEIEDAQDVTLTLEASEAEITRRGSGWRATLQAIKDASVEFDLVYDPTDTEFIAIREAFFDRETIEMAVMDGPIATAGSQGLRATMSVLNFSRNEPLEEALTVSVTVKPAPAANDPEWKTISGGG